MKRFFKEIIVSFVLAVFVQLWSPIPFIAWWSIFYAGMLVINLMNAIGRKIPFQELMTSIMGVQLLISPFLEYYVFQFKIMGGMHVPAEDYFQYSFWCTVFLNLGISLFYPTTTLESNLFQLLEQRRNYIEPQGILLIIIGYVGYLSIGLLPGLNAEFLIYLLSFSRFIGFLYLWGSNSKYTPWAFVLVMIPFAIETVNQTVFINLLVYLTLLMTLYFMKHRTSRIKIYFFLLLSGIVLMSIQSVKSSVRRITNKEHYQGNTSVLFAQSLYELSHIAKSEDLKAIGSLVNLRVNQGWILSDIMHHFENNPEKINTGYFRRELLGIILPRFIYPNKPIVGDHKKFKAMAGWKLGKKVAMSVGLMGDGYGNFGFLGGILYCLFFGIFFGLLFLWWHQVSHLYPTLLLWGALIFFYSMRAGDETYIILNFTVKSIIFVFLYFIFFERKNRIDRYLAP